MVTASEAPRGDFSRFPSVQLHQQPEGQADGSSSFPWVDGEMELSRGRVTRSGSHSRSGTEPRVPAPRLPGFCLDEKRDGVCSARAGGAHSWSSASRHSFLSSFPP